MSAVDLTPKQISDLYRKMSKNIEIVRNRLKRPLTLSEKTVLSHLDDPDTQELEPGKSYLYLRPDRVAFQDVLGQTGFLQFMQTGLARVAVPTTVHCDHLIQARTEGVSDLEQSLSENKEVYSFLKSVAAKYGAGFWEPGAGIIHQVILENYAFPGAMIIGTDSHTPNGGGMGACALGVGGADAVEVISGLPWELLYPRRIGIYLTGEMSGWTAPKDVILYVAGQLGVSGGTNAIIEYIGPGAETISATGKATITNMGAELGATTSMFPTDERMYRYLQATGRETLIPIIEEYRDLLVPDPEVLANPQDHYDQVLELNLSKLEPHIVGPHSPDRARPLSKMAEEVKNRDNQFVDKISAALMGSCTNSSYEDMTRAADVAKQAVAHGIKVDIPFYVTPGSERIRSTIGRDGQLHALEGVNATVLANACGPCIGQWRRTGPEVTEPNTLVTSFNRNFPARKDGQATTMNFIASPEIVTALALAGRLSFNPMTDELIGADGEAFMLQPPEIADEVPVTGFINDTSAFQNPPEDGLNLEVKIDPESARLQRLTPWPEWDSRDFDDCFILTKAKGKTTTDQISPAGPWLSLRGHLDKFSDNLLMGSKSAYDGKVGLAVNGISGQSDQLISAVARAYKKAGAKWVIIGDDNYGEGSSREHAALSPRLLGGAAVIARSFARIHETNLKKQGLLALTFRDTFDYDRIRQDDRISLINLSDLAPGEPVEGVLAHTDGQTETIWFNHSYSRSQLAWFRAGSALNLVRQKQNSAERVA